MVRFIILLLILILALSYFGISIRHVVESPTGQDNLLFVWANVKEGWHLLISFIEGLIRSLGAAF